MHVRLGRLNLRRLLPFLQVQPAPLHVPAMDRDDRVPRPAVRLVFAFLGLRCRLLQHNPSLGNLPAFAPGRLCLSSRSHDFWMRPR